MLKFIDLETGAAVNLDHAIAEANCPICGAAHTVELNELARLAHGLWNVMPDMRLCCPECSGSVQRLDGSGIVAFPGNTL